MYLVEQQIKLHTINIHQLRIVGQISLTIYSITMYLSDDNIDLKISVQDFIEEQNSNKTPFTIELDDYIDIWVRLNNDRIYIGV